MRRLTILMGLPASGKSTCARTLLDGNTVIVSMDGIRRMLVGGEPLQEAYHQRLRSNNHRIEPLVFREYLGLCATLINEGFDVVADAQNLGYDSQIQLIGACVDRLLSVDVVSFPQPLETLLERNRMRPESERVPEGYLRDQYSRWARELEHDPMQWEAVRMRRGADGVWREGAGRGVVFMPSDALGGYRRECRECLPDLFPHRLPGQQAGDRLAFLDQPFS